MCWAASVCVCVCALTSESLDLQTLFLVCQICIWQDKTRQREVTDAGTKVPLSLHLQCRYSDKKVIGSSSKSMLHEQKTDRTSVSKYTNYIRTSCTIVFGMTPNSDRCVQYVTLLDLQNLLRDLARLKITVSLRSKLRSEKIAYCAEWQIAHNRYFPERPDHKCRKLIRQMRGMSIPWSMIQWSMIQKYLMHDPTIDRVRVVVWLGLGLGLGLGFVM